MAEHDLESSVELQATFCMEACDRGPTVRVAGQALHRADLESVRGLLEKAVAGRSEVADARR